jgi:hypothetical protein
MLLHMSPFPAYLDIGFVTEIDIASANSDFTLV